MWFNENGNLVEQVTFDSNNRSFKYGDGIFETLKLFNSSFFNKKNHALRIEKSLAAVHISLSVSVSDLLVSALKLAKKNNIKNGSVRISIFRSGLGKYTPNTNDGYFFIETFSDEHAIFKLNKHGLELGYFTNHQKPKGSLSNLKSTSAILYVLASIDKKERKLDDLLLLNTDLEPIEACSSNIFLVRKGKLLTPSLESGCLEGCMRAFILEHFEVEQINISKEDVYESSELILTNSNSIRWVKSLDDKVFESNEFASRIVMKCNELI
jgi:branched-chain amino acid aminotransferase